MTKKVEINYTFMVGNMYVKTITHSGVSLSTYEKDIIRVHDESEYMHSTHYVGHVKRIQDYLKRLEEHGITDVKVIQTKVVTETVEQEVELKPVHADAQMALFPVVNNVISEDAGIIATNGISTMSMYSGGITFINADAKIKEYDK